MFFLLQLTQVVDGKRPPFAKYLELLIEIAQVLSLKLLGLSRPDSRET